jgi:hypothetical protein
VLARRLVTKLKNIEIREHPGPGLAILTIEDPNRRLEALWGTLHGGVFARSLDISFSSADYSYGYRCGWGFLLIPELF